jgi:pimeloyl-ACP methyl ester carboxylesterase
MAQERPSIFHRMILVGTALRGGEDILQGYQVLQKIFFAPTESRRAAGAAFIERRKRRAEDREPISGPAAAQRKWPPFANGSKFQANFHHPTLVVNGDYDEMIPVSNSYWLSAHLPNAVLLTYPDSGHGSLFQFHETFTRAAAFLASVSVFAPHSGAMPPPQSPTLSRLVKP